MTRDYVYFDDLDKTPGATPVTFALEGKEYEIDLVEEHLEELRAALERFIAVARPVTRQPELSGVRGSGQRRRSSGTGRDDLAEIRAWAQAQGKNVSARGRIEQEIIEAYDEAHQTG